MEKCDSDFGAGSDLRGKHRSEKPAIHKVIGVASGGDQEGGQSFGDPEALRWFSEWGRWVGGRKANDEQPGSICAQSQGLRRKGLKDRSKEQTRNADQKTGREDQGLNQKQPQRLQLRWFGKDLSRYQCPLQMAGVCLKALRRQCRGHASQRKGRTDDQAANRNAGGAIADWNNAPEIKQWNCWAQRKSRRKADQAEHSHRRSNQNAKQLERRKETAGRPRSRTEEMDRRHWVAEHFLG